MRSFKLTWELDEDDTLTLKTQGFISDLTCKFNDGVKIDPSDPIALIKIVDEGVKPVPTEGQLVERYDKPAGTSGVHVKSKEHQEAVPGYDYIQTSVGNVIFKKGRIGPYVYNRYSTIHADWRYVNLIPSLLCAKYNMSDEEVDKIWNLSMEAIKSEPVREGITVGYSHQGYPIADPYDRLLIYVYAGSSIKEREGLLNLWESVPKYYLRMLIRYVSLSAFNRRKHNLDLANTESILKVYNRVKDIMVLPSKMSPYKVIKLNKYPTTKLQAALVAAAFEASLYKKEFLEELFDDTTPIREIPKVLTKTFMMHISAGDKLLHIDMSVTADLNELIESHFKWAVSLRSLQDFRSYLKDGKDYSSREGYSKVKGSFARRLMSSAYNHRLATAEGLDLALERMKSSVKEDTVRDTPTGPTEITPIIKETYLNCKIKVIELGHELGHCFGQRHSTKNWLLNKGTVCAEIDRETGAIVECRDKRNIRTDESRAFEEELKTELGILRGDRWFTKEPPTPAVSEDFNEIGNLLEGIQKDIEESTRQYAHFGKFIIEFKHGDTVNRKEYEVAYTSPEETPPGMMCDELRSMIESTDMSVFDDGRINW